MIVYGQCWEFSKFNEASYSVLHKLHQILLEKSVGDDPGAPIAKEKEKEKKSKVEIRKHRSCSSSFIWR